MNKFKLALTVSIALATAFTFSCSGDSNSGGGDGGDPSTESYAIKSKTSNSITYTKTYGDWCFDGGILDLDTHDQTMYYSIENKAATVGFDSYSLISKEDTLMFKGTTDVIIGTWTRTKNKNTSCQPYRHCIDYNYNYDYDNYTQECIEYREEDYLDCKEGWDITKVVVSENNIKITQDYCATDEMVDGSWGEDGWKIKITGCDTYEVYKGNTKVTIKENKDVWEMSYGSKKCKMSEPTKSQKQSACSAAWNECRNINYGDCLDEIYRILLWGSFDECLERDMPPGLFGGGREDGGSAGEPVYKKSASVTAKKIPFAKKR